MKDLPLSRLVLSLFTAGILLFSGCSDSEPELVSAKGYVVFDFQDETKTPSSRLAAFAEISSEVRRVSSIRIKNLSTDFEWNCLTPAIFANDKKQWSGYAEFLSPDGMEIPSGIYDFFYADAQGKEVSSAFLISYDEKLAGSTAEKAVQLVQENSKELYALYTATPILLYFGPPKHHWTEASKIFTFYKQAAYSITIYTVTNSSVVFIMPPVYTTPNS